MSLSAECLKWCSAALLLVVTTGNALDRTSVKIQRQEFGTGPVSRLLIDNPIGDIRVRAAEGQLRSRLLLVCQLKQPMDRLPAKLRKTAQGGVFTVTADSNTIRCDLTAIVPHTQNLDIMARQGRVSVKNLHAPLNLKAEDQPVQVQNHGPVEITSQAGNIDLQLPADAPQASVTTRTGHVAIELSGALNSNIRVQTAGDVTSDSSALLQAMTRERNLRVAQLGAGSGAIQVQSDAGNVRLLGDASRHPHRLRQKW